MLMLLLMPTKWLTWVLLFCFVEVLCVVVVVDDHLMIAAVLWCCCNI